jgi:hypothetical protein
MKVGERPETKQLLSMNGHALILLNIAAFLLILLNYLLFKHSYDITPQFLLFTSDESQKLE